MEEQKTLQLQGQVETLIYENPDSGYSVFEVSANGEAFVVCGTVGEVHIGEQVTCIGHFETHAAYGKQFKADSCQAEIPQDEQAIYSYLASGALPYIGAATAKKLVARFGPRPWRS